MTEPVRHAEEVMGTVVSFDVRTGACSAADVSRAIAAACELLHEVDATYSVWMPDSPINRYRRGEARIEELPTDMYDVLELCSRARRLTGGWFDAWAMPGGFDPTGLVKGWAAARALTVLRDAGVEAAVVNAGGDIAVFGEPEPGRGWTIAVPNPAAPDTVAFAVRVDHAIATSGTYERGEHILDPHTKEPGSVLVSATVVGPDLAIADAFATAIVAGGDAAFGLLGEEGYAACLIDAAGEMRATSGFPFVE